MAVRPVYSMAEVGAMLGKSRDSARRYVKAAGLEVDKTMKGKHHVWLVELQNRCPDLWESATLARSANRAEQLDMFG